jgi:hypothetical protein
MAWDQKTINFFKMLIEDTLMEYDKHKKRYALSMRRISIAVCLPYALSVGCNIVYGGNKNSLAIEVFQTIFLFVTIGLGYNIYTYMKNEKPKDDNQTPTE